MIDPFIVLTPILLLGVVALLGFAGCSNLFGITKIPYSPPVARVFQQAANQNSGVGPFTVTYTPAPDAADVAVVVSVHWGSSGGAAAKIAVNGVTPQTVESDAFNPQTVAHFLANNIDLSSGQIDVSVGLSSSSNTAWDYCVSVYTNVDQTTSFDSPVSRQGTAQGTIPDAMNSVSINSSAGQMIYVAAVSQTTGGFLGGNLSAGSGFNLVSGPISYFLVEDLPIDSNTTEPVAPVATVAGGARWYFFAMEINFSSQAS